MSPRSTAERHRLSVRAIQPLLSGLEAMGHDPAPILSAAGIAASELDDPDGRLPRDAGIRLLARAGDLTGDDNLGFHLALYADLRTVDVHCYSMRSSPTLGAAFECLSRYQRLIHDAAQVDLSIDGESACLRHTASGGFRLLRQSAEFVMAAWVRAGRLVTGIDWVPAEVRFSHPVPAGASELERYFRSPVRFAAGENALLMSTKLLAMPCVGSDPVLLSIMARLATDRLGSLEEAPPFVRRARAAIGARLHAGESSASAVASQLEMSPRTFSRMLASEGTTYRDLLEQFRRDLATRHLQKRTLSIAEIAFLLGFSDLSAFHRAFKRWTGQTPAHYRRHAQVAQSSH